MYKAQVNIDNEFGSFKFELKHKRVTVLMHKMKERLFQLMYPAKNVVFVRVRNRPKEWSMMHGSRCIGCIQYDSGTD